MQTLINNRDDLDAIAGSVEHDAFMEALRGTLWRIEKDDIAGVWRAVEDNSTIQRFGFTRADFPNAQPPNLPEYVPLDNKNIKIRETKSEAQRRIFARYPQTKQANMSARFNELNAIESGRYRDAIGVLQPARALTASEIAEIASCSAAWIWIKQVRAASDLIEADIQASADPANFDVINSPRWPV